MQSIGKIVVKHQHDKNKQNMLSEVTKREEESRNEEIQPKYSTANEVKIVENQTLVETSPEPVETLNADDSSEVQNFSDTIENRFHSVLTR